MPLDPSRPDALGVEDYIKGSAAFLKNSSMPMTMSIQGAWGSGKTSFMLKLRQQLCEGRDAPYYGVWVRAWEHSSFAGQGEGSAPAMTMVSMLNSMIRDILPIVEENKSRSEQFMEKGKNALAKMKKLPVLQMMAAGAGGFMLSAAAQTAVNALGATAKLASAANAPQAEEDASCSGENPISRLRADLAENIRFCVERSGRRGFIFFIDDLDRLAPSVAVGFIELLKNIFDLGSCIFVLAIDYDVVVKGLRDKFGDKTESNEHEFRSFFDKIIQVPFTMPMSSYDVRLFLRERFAAIGYFSEKQLAAAIRRKFSDDPDDIPDLLENEKPTLLDLAEGIVRYSCGPNPRSIIRMLNTLSLLSLIRQSKNPSDGGDSCDGEEARILLFALIALQMTYEKVYDLLTVSPDFSGWDDEFALRQNLAELDERHREQIAGLNLTEQWMRVVSRACRTPKRTAGAVELLRIILALCDRATLKSGGEAADEGRLHGLREEKLSLFVRSTMTTQAGWDSAEQAERTTLMANRGVSRDEFCAGILDAWTNLKETDLDGVKRFADHALQRYGSAIVAAYMPASRSIGINFDPSRKKGRQKSLFTLRLDKAVVTLNIFAHEGDARQRKVPYAGMDALIGEEKLWEDSDRYLAENVDLDAPAKEQTQQPPEKAPAPSAAHGDDLISRLERLAALRDRGVLTEDEFAAEKARLLRQG